MLDKTRDKIQKQALQKWIDNDKNGILELVTGAGKTFIALHALYTMHKRDGKVHLFLAETTERKKDLYKDILKYNKIFNRNVLNDYTLKFFCYQSVYKFKNKSFGLIIGDECHDSFTPSYSKFYFNNKYDAFIGLSASVNTTVKYQGITKKQLMNKIAPIVFTYNTKQALKDNNTRNLNIYVIYTELDSKQKIVKAGSKKKLFYQTEQSAYDYWDKRHKRSFFIANEEQKQLQIAITAKKRKDIIYNSINKLNDIKKLISYLKNKTILFGNDISKLLEITPNVISSRNSDEKNNRIRNSINKGTINLIGSFKKLKQGANIEGLDNAIFMSYYSSDVDSLQRAGRLRKADKDGNIFIFVTKNTQEEIWFSKMIKSIEQHKIIYCSNIDDCLNKIKK